MKKNRLIYNAFAKTVPHLLNLQLGDRFRYNSLAHFYTVIDIYQGWAIGVRRHSKGYNIAVISQFDFTSCDLEDYDLHIVFNGLLKYKGTLSDGYRLIEQEVRKGIDSLNRGFAYESKNCIYSLTIEKGVTNEKKD